jgi:hypothetical protein
MGAMGPMGGGMPPLDPMMGGGMPPLGPPGMGAPPMGGDPMMGGMDPAMGGMMPPSEDEMLIQLMQAAMGKWSSGEAQIAGEKSGIIQTLMMILGAAPPGPEAFAGGADMAMDPGPLAQEPPTGAY